MEAFLQRWNRRLRGPITAARVFSYLRRRLGPNSHPVQPPRHISIEVAAQTAAAAAYVSHYPDWIRARVHRRRSEYPDAVEPNLFSIITPVYDVAARFLHEAARSVFAQDYPFEWCICDNGSQDPATLAAIGEISKDPRVKWVRLEQNAGIMGGMNAAFKLATARYVLPLDSDDLLYPDALRVMAACLRSAHWPALAFSDEDKIDVHSVPQSPFFKPGWDPVLFRNCCYIAHLCAVDRAEALRLNAYCDDRARGCHDWDTFTRLIAAGHVPIHVPEVLYSWRVHPGSTSSAAARAKPYTLECQEYVLSRFLSGLPSGNRFEMRTNPLFGHTGMWYAARKHVHARRIHLILTVGAAPARFAEATRSFENDPFYPDLQVTVMGAVTPEHRRQVDALQNGSGIRITLRQAGEGVLRYLQGLADEVDGEDLIVLMTDQMRIDAPGWEWDACGAFDIDSDTVGCTPRVFAPDGLLAEAGRCFGFGGIVGAPDMGRSSRDSGYHGHVFCQRTVAAASQDFAIWSARFLKSALKEVWGGASRAFLPAWLSATAAEQGQRIVCWPHILVQRLDGYQPDAVGYEESFQFLSRYHHLVSGESYYPRFLSLSQGHGYTVALPHERADQLHSVLYVLQGRTHSTGDPPVDPIEYRPHRDSTKRL